MSGVKCLFSDRQFLISSWFYKGFYWKFWVEEGLKFKFKSESATECRPRTPTRNCEAGIAVGGARTRPPPSPIELNLERKLTSSWREKRVMTQLQCDYGGQRPHFVDYSLRPKARMWQVLPPVAKIKNSILYPSSKLGWSNMISHLPVSDFWAKKMWGRDTR